MQFLRQAAKKVTFLVARPLREGPLLKIIIEDFLLGSVMPAKARPSTASPPYIRPRHRTTSRQGCQLVVFPQAKH